MCLLESGGVCLFVFVLPGKFKPALCVLLMGCVFIAPTFVNLVWSFAHRNDDESIKEERRCHYGAFLLELIACGLTGMCHFLFRFVKRYISVPILTNVDIFLTLIVKTLVDPGSLMPQTLNFVIFSLASLAIYLGNEYHA